MDKIKNNIGKFEGFIAGLSVDYSYNKGEIFVFNLLVRASIIKCYEFLRAVFLENREIDYFIYVTYLRSIVEDIVVLKSIQTIPQSPRDALLRKIQEIEVADRILTQWDFFQKYRPFQSVIDRSIDIEDAKIEIQKIWQENGWPNFKTERKSFMPPVRQLAEKLAPGILDVLYDFIYRLTSSTVHFSVQSLFRMSWGTIQEEEFRGNVSVRHMSNYDEAFCKIYGTLLFTFYFEFFAEEISMALPEQMLVQDLRKELIEIIRWPELITFEEMNLEIPKAYHDNLIPNLTLHKYFVETLKDGFISKKFEMFLNQIKLE